MFITNTKTKKKTNVTYMISHTLVALSVTRCKNDTNQKRLRHFDELCRYETCDELQTTGVYDDDFVALFSEHLDAFFSDFFGFEK